MTLALWGSRDRWVPGLNRQPAQLLSESPRLLRELSKLRLTIALKRLETFVYYDICYHQHPPDRKQ